MTGQADAMPLFGERPGHERLVWPETIRTAKDVDSEPLAITLSLLPTLSRFGAQRGCGTGRSLLLRLCTTSDPKACVYHEFLSVLSLRLLAVCVNGTDY